jgi:hypothetical protein
VDVVEPKQVGLGWGGGGERGGCPVAFVFWGGGVERVGEVGGLGFVGERMARRCLPCSACAPCGQHIVELLVDVVEPKQVGLVCGRVCVWGGGGYPVAWGGMRLGAWASWGTVRARQCLLCSACMPPTMQIALVYMRLCHICLLCAVMLLLRAADCHQQLPAAHV